MADKRFSQAAWLYGTVLSSGGKDTFIQHFALDDGEGAILGTAGNPLNVTGGGAAGGATEAKQDTQITAADLTNTRLGDVTAPAAGSVNARLATLNTTLGSPLQAGGTVVVTGVATAAKQPALGTAGTASTDVLTVQGIASMTPLLTQGPFPSANTGTPNPFLIAAQHNTVAPTFTNGQLGYVQMGTRGSIYTTLRDENGTTAVTISTVAADAQSTNFVGLQTRSFSYVFNGSSWDRQVGNTSGTVTQPYAVAASRWVYAAAASGISNTTTAVTIAAAAGGSLRNYVTSIQIDSTALGAATEIAIRDGAGGTVLWRGQIGTAGWVNGREIVFPVPLKGTANTLLEVVTLTASVTGAVYFNAQGYTAL